MSKENQEQEIYVAPETEAQVEASSTDQNEVAPVEVSRTTRFQNELQANLGLILGKKISRETAWKLYKECIDTTVVFVSKDEEKKLPLSGVGTFQIKMSPPRKPVVREGEEPKKSKYADLPELPRFRFKPSERYRKYLLEELTDYKEPVEEESLKAESSEG